MLSNPYPWLVSTLFMLPGILLAIPAHELGHALVAHWLGDRTPINRGELGVANPRRFFTMYGLAMLIFWRVGWGDRIQVRDSQYSTRNKVLYELGGPAANLVLAVVFGLLARPFLLYLDPVQLIQPPVGLLESVLYAAYFVNLSVMAFNLLPIPGLDGWRIIEALFRRRNPRFFYDVSIRQPQIVNALILGLFVAQFVAGNLLNVVMVPFYAPFATLILGQCSGYIGLAPCLPSGRL